MPEQRTATLTTIFSDVLADLAFMFNDDSDEVQFSSEELWLESSISYLGGTTGTLRLRCTRTFSVSLAANLLGVDPADNDAESKADDAVKEFMNIVCGQLITALHGTEQVFDLTIPEIHVLPEMPCLEDDGTEETVAITVEGQQLQLAYLPGDGPRD